MNNGTPVITLSNATATMWPPNHQYQTFNITDFVASASSSCDTSVDINDVVIQKVSSDEVEENPAGADGSATGSRNSADAEAVDHPGLSSCWVCSGEPCAATGLLGG